MTRKPTLNQRYGCQLTAKVLSASAGPLLANYWLFIYKQIWRYEKDNAWPTLRLSIDGQDSIGIAGSDIGE